VTYSTDIGLVGVDVLLAFQGTSVTYSEAVSGTAQAVTALEENFRVDSDDEAVMEFTFETTDLTISNWRGAKIASSAHGTFAISEREDSYGHTKFTGRRPLERS